MSNAVALTPEHRARLVASGFLQVVCVAANTVFIVEWNIPLALASSFAISWLWSSNVRRIAFGDTLDRVCYAAGAAAGCLAGMGLGRLLA